jgi:hypothetical protein
MYDYILEEMADAIANELHIEHNSVLGILNRYWQDKIAHVWQVDDMLESAHYSGKPITRPDAAGLLHNVFDHLDSSMGISWINLDVALEDYCLDLKTLTEDQYKDVYGVFKVWRQGNLIAHQFGMFPNKMDGNLPIALEFAKRMAKEIPGTPVFIGCEVQLTDQAEPWLTVILSEGKTEPIIEQSEESCTPSNQINMSAS